jgi:uracil-DNA glycosylase
MLQASIDPTFDSWRETARVLLSNGVEPKEILWSDGSEPSLPMPGQTFSRAGRTGPSFTVPPAFISLGRAVAMHRDPGRWSLLYRILFRLIHEQPKLLAISVDEDVHRLEQMQRSVRRDIHKMHAFVRFRRVATDGDDCFVAFHRPDHLIVPAAGPWFAKRFPTMRWTIFTPDASVAWDGNDLVFGLGVAASPAGDDAIEDLWRTYYASIFNPARIKVNAMKKEMPIRHWATLPETQLIDELLADAPQRVEEMMTKAPKVSAVTAADFVPPERRLEVLRDAASGCKGCELYCNATQTVFGEGPTNAAAMFVGEQPGDQEDVAGKPFVGPAGRLLNEALQRVGIDRSQLYVTNAVKHFKFEQRGTRRIHSKPSAREVSACKPWLVAEIETLKPKMIVALGATAAQSMMGPEFRITQSHGRVFSDTKWAPWFMATIHPSALLRIPDPVLKEQTYKEFLEDLSVAAKQLSQR